MDAKHTKWEEYKVGDTAAHSKTITDTDVFAFCGISGDFNPIHVDAEFARGSRYGRRIAHGLISVSLIAGVLGMKLPGPGAIHVSQTANFRKPVFIGDTLTVTAEVKEKFQKKNGELKFIRITTNVHNQEGALVTEGEALALVD